jgi:hypothetical protein
VAAPKIAAEYIGQGGEHLGNVPASDLTEDQMDALTGDQRTALLANAASEHAIYKLHGRDLKAEAKDVAEDVAPPAPAAAPPGAPVVAPAPRASAREGKAG